MELRNGPRFPNRLAGWWLSLLRKICFGQLGTMTFPTEWKVIKVQTTNQDTMLPRFGVEICISMSQSTCIIHCPASWAQTSTHSIIFNSKRQNLPMFSVSRPDPQHFHILPYASIPSPIPYTQYPYSHIFFEQQLHSPIFLFRNTPHHSRC